MSNYNPFGKDILEIETSDLAVLTNVSEGWYVDYKQEIISIKNIAKHISSFANQYGGWLFFGIKESSEQTAGNFIGINKEDIQKLSTLIREAVSVHCNPEVYYEEKVIYGPDKLIGLLDNKAIYIVFIPEGKNPPYVHSSGKIYRRISDHSNPKAETDRHVLDLLWRKKQNNDELVKSFLKYRHSYTVNNPIAYIYFLTNRYFEKRFDLLKFKDFRDSLTSTMSGSISVPMNTFYSAIGGYIARQTKGNNPLNPVASLRWWHSGTALLTIPFNYYDLNGLRSHYNYSENSILFASEAEKQQLEHGMVCDLSYFLFCLAGLYNQFKQILHITNNRENIYANITIENTFHSLSFVDDLNYINRIREYGIPLVQDEKIKIPNSATDDTLIKLSKNENINNKYDHVFNESLNAILEILPIVGPVLFAFGVLNELEEAIKFHSLFDFSKLVK